jgi:hypothetical protein
MAISGKAALPSCIEGGLSNDDCVSQKAWSSFRYSFFQMTPVDEHAFAEEKDMSPH